jgi:putative endonuclease
MKPIGLHNYFVYITTNTNKNVLYTGVTNNLENRLNEHLLDSLEQKKHFAVKYNCIYLIYFERFQFIEQAIKREKEIKGWRRSKKIDLINSINKNWDFLNDSIKD